MLKIVIPYPNIRIRYGISGTCTPGIRNSHIRPGYINTNHAPSLQKDIFLLFSWFESNFAQTFFSDLMDYYYSTKSTVHIKKFQTKFFVHPWCPYVL